MRIEGWKLPQLNFKKPLAGCHGNRKVHPIAMATGKHRGLPLGLGIWDVAGGGGCRRLGLGCVCVCVGGMPCSLGSPPHTHTHLPRGPKARLGASP